MRIAINPLRHLVLWLPIAVSFATPVWAHKNLHHRKFDSHSLAMASALANKHAYLLQPAQRELLRAEIRSARNRNKTTLPDKVFLNILESVKNRVKIDLEDGTPPDTSAKTSIVLPGDRGAILFRVQRGPGPTHFHVTWADLSRIQKTFRVPSASSGTTWVLVSFIRVPAGQTHLYASLNREDNEAVQFPILLNAPKLGRLRVRIISDDNGKPSPAMVQLKWLYDGSIRAPSSTVNFNPQFNSLGEIPQHLPGSRYLKLPGREFGNFWVANESFDMMLPPGDWKITILRGIEHLPIEDTFTIRSGKTIDKKYRPLRWTKMADRGWYSGDDHVHAQILNQSDAERLLTWARAEDIHVLNILEMGDHERTYFQQRAYGKPGRTRKLDTILVPGQEDPRITSLGHTIALNIPERVRDVSKYYLHDWYHDRVHELGGLFGYAHVNLELFNIERDMTLNLPFGKVDFVELLQFHKLGTRLYYEFLNLGEKINASAGSDVPWGATVGEVRVYAFLGNNKLSSDAWFEALGRGRTFVTNGPMIDFSVNDALPGDEIAVDTSTRKVRVKARTWGHPERALPERLEIIRHGKVVHSVDNPDSSPAPLSVDFELDPGPGCWVAARTYAFDGSVAHTTPIYLKRPGLRVWDYEQIPDLIARRMQVLKEIEAIAGFAKNPEPMFDGVQTGSLIGVWFSKPNLTHPRAIDLFENAEQNWRHQPIRGDAWSARWTGTITLPDNHPTSLILHLASPGPASLTLDGQTIIQKENAGDAGGSYQFKPGQNHEIILTYTHVAPSPGYLKFSWNTPGGEEQPVPSQWLAYRQPDHRAAIKFLTAENETQNQLTQQSNALIQRIDKARGRYQDLLIQWKHEASERKKYTKNL